MLSRSQAVLGLVLIALGLVILCFILLLRRMRRRRRERMSQLA